MFIDSPQAGQLTKQERHVFLHEMSHALIDMKHFKPHQSDDLPPFCDISCKDSLMAYRTDCQEEIRKTETAFLREPTHKTIKDHVNHLLKIDNIQPPDSLTAYDLHSCAEFLHELHKKNEERLADLESKSEIENMKLEVKLMKTKLDDIYNKLRNSAGIVNQIKIYLNDSFNSFVETIEKYTLDVVESCPSYFCQDNLLDQTLSPRSMLNNSSSFFATHKLPVQALNSSFTPQHSLSK